MNIFEKLLTLKPKGTKLPVNLFTFKTDKGVSIENPLMKMFKTKINK